MLKSKYVKNKMQKLNHCENGVMLIEIVISIAILVIVAMPFLGSVLSSTRNNVMTREKLVSITLLQQTMEHIKARPNFLAEEAGALTYQEYKIVDGYTINYRITEQSGNININQDYEFNKLDEVDFNLIFTVNGGQIIHNTNSYSIENNKPFLLEVEGTSGVYSYKLKNNLDIELINGSILNTNPINIKIEFNEGSTDIFTFRVNIDELDNDLEDTDPMKKKVYFYIVDDVEYGLSVTNDGSVPYFVNYHITSNSVDYFNKIYIIELEALRNGRRINNLVSYVKK